MNTNTQKFNKFDSQNFETLKYDILNKSNDILLDNLYDLDLNLFSKNIRNLDPYISADDFCNFLGKQMPGFLSILYLNIQTIKYISKNFKSFLCSLDFAFGIMFFRQHGLMISVILYMICLNTKVIIKKGVIAKVGQYLSIFTIYSYHIKKTKKKNIRPVGMILKTIKAQMKPITFFCSNSFFIRSVFSKKNVKITEKNL